MSSPEPPADRPLVIAHRGASAARPENTVEAFRHAARLGADWVELDVRRTADGALVVHHDAVLPDGRTIVELAAGQLPPSVPSLDAALDTCAEAGLGVNVEIKNWRDDPDFDPTEQLARVVTDLLVSRAAAGTTDLARILVTSFNPRTVEVVRERRPEVATGQLAFELADPAAIVERTAAAGHAALNPWDGHVDAALVERAHAAGLAVYPWTVDDPHRMAELVALGVEGIITNMPDVGRAVVDA